MLSGRLTHFELLRQMSALAHSSLMQAQGRARASVPEDSQNTRVGTARCPGRPSALEEANANTYSDDLLQAYERLKASDPNFFRDKDDLVYGTAPKPAEANVERLVAELVNQKRRKQDFSRRRAHHADKDIDFINDRNAHFNKKIERAFGDHTREIRANLERGTALPDH